MHVHYGAGNLGMGLVVPSLVKRNTPFLLVQRNSEIWKPISADNITLRINDKKIADIKVARSIEDVTEPATLLISDDARKWYEAAEMSKSMSCSLGRCDSVLSPILSRFPYCPKTEQRNLYACENDDRSVRRLRYSLHGKVNVVQCVVDLICTGKRVTQDNIDVYTEKHPGSIFVFDDDIDSEIPSNEIAFDMETMDDPGISDYIFTEKLLLLNSLHAIVALLSTKNLYNQDDECMVSMVTSLDEIDQDMYNNLMAWGAACGSFLVNNYGFEAIATAHSLGTRDEVLEYLRTKFDSNIERILSTEDDPLRILRKGTKHAIESRVDPIFFNAMDQLSEDVCKKFDQSAAEARLRINYIARRVRV